MTVVGVVGIGWQEEAAFDYGALRALTHDRGVGALAHKQFDRRKQRGFAGARFARDHREALRGRERRFANKGDILHVELVEHGETFLEYAAARCDGQVSSIIGSWGARLRAARKPKGNGESARTRPRNGELCACEDGPWSCTKPERGFSRGTRAIKKPARLSGL